MTQLRRYLTVGCLVIVFALLLSAWTARAAPQLNPPPVIWCPGPGGVMALCSPVPTPQACRPAPRARPQSEVARFWATTRRRP